MERLREKRSCARRLAGAGRGGRGRSAAMDVREKGAVYVHTCTSKSGKGEQRRASERAGRWKWTSSTQEEGEERNEE